MADGDVNEISSIISEFNTKIVDIEGRYEILKERMLLSNESFLKTRDNLNNEIRNVKNEVAELKKSVEKIKEIAQHLMNETEAFARKEQIGVLERYMKMWEPLKFVKAEEVKEMINEAIESHKSKLEKAKLSEP